MNRPREARQALEDMPAIARAVLEDAQAIIDLQRRAFAEEAKWSDTQDIAPLQESLAAIEEHIRDQTARKARVEGTIIGWELVVKPVANTRRAIVRGGQ